MKTQEEYAREIDEIVRRDVESCQIDWFKIDKEIFMLPENKNKTFILGTRKTGCDLLMLGGTNCDESYLDGVFGCLGMARYFILSFRFDKNECEALLDKNDPNDKMNEFIDGFIFNRNNHIKKLDDIGYHKIGEVFKYDIGSGIIELAVIEDDGSGCDGCIFNDRNYYCKNTCCINVDRKDSTDIIYKEVKRS